MKVKIIYFSLDGNTKLIAERIKQAIGADIVQLETAKPFPQNGFNKFLIGGKSTLFGETPALKEYDENLDYDLIILGTPVWAGTVAPPLRTFLSKADLKGKKTALFVCSGSASAEKSAALVKKLQPDCELIDTACFFNPAKNDTSGQKDKAARWAEGLIRQIKK